MASIWAHEGKITVLFGRNGCGKSTLLRIGAGLLSSDDGAIHFAGRVFQRPRLVTLARLGLFYLPDRNLLSTRLTVREQIRAAEWSCGATRTSGIIDRLELGNRLDQTALQLSGGEQRRAELALAWIRAPRCLLVDEPLAGIAPADRDIVADVLRELAQEGCAIIASGHETERLLDMADDIVWMTAGTTHGLGTPALARQHEQFQREYLGPARFSG
jgi:ABC-type multidrug transport system ATPase subunit